MGLPSNDPPLVRCECPLCLSPKAVRAPGWAGGRRNFCPQCLYVWGGGTTTGELELSHSRVAVAMREGLQSAVARAARAGQSTPDLAARTSFHESIVDTFRRKRH